MNDVLIELINSLNEEQIAYLYAYIKSLLESGLI